MTDGENVRLEDTGFSVGERLPLPIDGGNPNLTNTILTPHFRDRMAGERRHSGAADPSHPAHSLQREIGPAHETRGHTKRIRRAVQIDDSHELPSSFEHAGSNGKKKRAGTGDDSNLHDDEVASRFLRSN